MGPAPTPDSAINSPVGAARLDGLMAVLGLRPRQRVIDVGCGNGEVLVRAVERFAVAGVGIDRDPVAVSAARATAGRRVPGADLTFHEADASAFPLGGGAFDVALCIGSAHALGGYRSALAALAQAIRPGGRVLIGELFWRCDPAEAYLAVPGEAKADRDDHAGNARVGAGRGLTLLYAAVSSEDEWDDFEGRHWTAALKVERAGAVDEPKRERVRVWPDAYLRWGRRTLGFGLYVFQT